jgi:catechol 2,3-dioxygenase-like lactoylglutathione lyase family enzyme
MFDHIGFRVRDVEGRRKFYLAALAPLGVGEAMEGGGAARNRAEVDAFHAAALAAGGKDNGAPGLRPHYHPNYYGAFAIDPDGHNIEAVCHRAAP